MSIFYVKLSKRDDVTRFFCSLNTILLRVSMDIVEACFVAIYPFCCLNLQIYRILPIVVVVHSLLRKYFLYRGCMKSDRKEREK